MSPTGCNQRSLHMSNQVLETICVKRYAVKRENIQSHLNIVLWNASRKVRIKFEIQRSTPATL